MTGISSVLPASGTTRAAQQAAASQPGSSGADFQTAINEALKNEYQQKALALTSPSGGAGAQSLTSPVTQGSGVEQLMLAAAASGETNDIQVALFMLLMMMQGGGDSGELMGVMSSMLAQMDTSSQGTLYDAAMDADIDRSVLLTAENELFSGLPATGDVTRTGYGAVVPKQSWKAATPAVSGDENSRTPEALREIIDQFGVESATRYEPFRNGSTYCNIFVWDVTSALGCEIPHYIDSETGLPRRWPDVSGAWEMNANATYDWLQKSGGDYGWREVSAEQAQQWANEGRPAVTAWKNTSGGSGHVQVVCPSEDGKYDGIRGVTVAQAGAQVTNYTHISSTFTRSQLKDVRYFIHD